MRIVSGKYKGRKINTLANRDVRPTSDRVREAIFSSLLSEIGTFENKNVLDAFGGSGALSLEAYSRGANRLLLFELNRNNAKNIQYNFNLLDVEKNQYQIIVSDVFKYAFNLKNLNNRFDLVFLDPPYKTNQEHVYSLLEKLFYLDVLDNNVIIVYEHSNMFNNSKLEWENDLFNIVKTKKYGNTICDFLKINLRR